MADINETGRSFDWLSFFVRVITGVAIVTWLLIERLQSHDRTGAALVAGIGLRNFSCPRLRPYALLQLTIHVWDR